MHRLDVMFISARRYVSSAESTVAVYGNEVRIRPNLWLHIRVDLTDKTAVAYVLTSRADGNNVVGVRDAAASGSAQGDISVAGTSVTQCKTADRRVAEACGVVRKRCVTDGSYWRHLVCC